MAKSALTAGILAIAAAGAAADELPGELRIDSRGERIEIDLGTLRTFTRDDDASRFSVRYDGKEVNRPRLRDRRVSIQAVPGGRLEIRHADFRLTVTFEASDKRRAAAARTTVRGEESAIVSVCDTGEGRWRLSGGEDRFPLWASGGTVTVDGVDIASKSPLLRGARSTLHLLSAREFTSWLSVAQACYEALLREQWAAFVATFNKHDREQAERYADCRLYWNAVRRTIERNNVVEFRFKDINPYGSKGSRRKLMFQRFDDDGKQVGYDTAIVLVLEDGEWRIDLVSP